MTFDRIWLSPRQGPRQRHEHEQRRYRRHRAERRVRGQTAGAEDQFEADRVGIVDAIAFVDLGHILGFGKGNVHTLRAHGQSIGRSGANAGPGVERSTYIIQGRAVLRRFDDLDGGVVANPGGVIHGEWHLRQAETAVVLQVVGSRDFEHRHHRHGVVSRHVAVPQIDVEECGGVTGKPARLDPDGAAGDGPLGAIFRNGYSAACEERDLSAHGFGTRGRRGDVSLDSLLFPMWDETTYTDRPIACHTDIPAHRAHSYPRPLPILSNSRYCCCFGDCSLASRDR